MTAAGEDAGRPRPGAVRTHVALRRGALSVVAAHEFVADPAAGAAVTFTGMVRDHAVPDGASDGVARAVTALDYEAYEGVAEQKIRDLLSEVADRWPSVRAMWAEHRVGALAVGDLAVVVAVSSPHRDVAFEAGRHLIDALKATVPIWKREHWADGGSHWPGTD